MPNDELVDFIVLSEKHAEAPITARRLFFGFTGRSIRWFRRVARKNSGDRLEEIDRAHRLYEVTVNAELPEAARTAFLINILNPKLSVFFLAFLPQFIDPAAGSAVPQLLVLGGIFMAMTFVVFVVYGSFAAMIGARLINSEAFMRWMRRGVAAAFAGFGLRLALSDR